MGKFSEQQIDDIFIYFLKKISFEISCKLSPQETICVKYQSLFAGINKKKIFQNVIYWNYNLAC